MKVSAEGLQVGQGLRLPGLGCELGAPTFSGPTAASSDSAARPRASTPSSDRFELIGGGRRSRRRSQSAWCR